MNSSSSQNEQLQQQQFQPAATFNELLINEVRSHPQLYDQQHRVCTDNGERNAIWEVIASRIDDSVNGEFAKKRWLQMRDRYRKELKMALRTSIQPKWPYFTKLAWLDPYLKDAKNIKPTVVTGAPHQQQNALGPLTDFGNNGHHQMGAIFRGDFAEQLRLSQFGNTVSFLESLMAASSAFLKQHKADDFSPDSAEASTSEGGDGGAVEQQQQSHNYNQSLHHNLLLRASSNILLGGIGNDLQATTVEQQRCSLSISPKDKGIEEEKAVEDGCNDNKNEEEEEEDGHDAADKKAKCHIDFTAGQSLLRRSASTSSPPGSAVDPSMELSLKTLFGRSSPLRLLGSTLLNSTTPTTSAVDTEHDRHQKQQLNHRRTLSAFTPASKSPVSFPMRHHRFPGNINGMSHRNGNGGNGQPPYLIRRGFGVSKFRGRFAGTLSSFESVNHARKFDIASMCSSPTSTADGIGGMNKEIGGIDEQQTTEEPTNIGKNNGSNNCWAEAMEWTDGGRIGMANTNGIVNSEDEDTLFARLVVARLKKFDMKERRAVRSRIFHWLDQKEEEMETITVDSK